MKRLSLSMKQKKEWNKCKQSKATHDSGEKINQPTVKETFLKKKKLDPNKPPAINLTNQIAKFIVGGLHTYSIVDEPEFKKIFDIVMPNYTVPSRSTFTRSIVPEMYNGLVKTIKAEINNDKSDLTALSFTSDGWTSRNQTGYMSLTCHYLNNSFEIKNYCLEIREMAQSHTAVNICETIKSVMRDWDLTNVGTGSTVPIYVVTDTARNMKSAVALSKFHHIDCFAHVLQLCIEDAIKENEAVKKLIGKCKSIVGHYSRSSTATARLKEEQRKAGLKELKLIQDVPTRWNSQFFMLERLLECRLPVTMELVSSQKSVLQPSEWELAIDVVKVLKPFVDVTRLLSAENYPTLSAVLPSIKGINKVLDQIMSTKNIPLGKSLKNKMKSRFAETTNELDYLLASVLDPRFKMSGLETEEQEVHAKSFLKSELHKVFKPPNPKKIATTNDENPIQIEPSEDQDIFSYLDEPEESNIRETQSDPTEIEMELYLKTAKLDRKDDPLQWWKKNKVSFPTLAKLAQKYLSIPATSVSSERLFSCAGNIVSARRSLLTPEHINELVVLHQNIHLLSQQVFTKQVKQVQKDTDKQQE